MGVQFTNRELDVMSIVWRLGSVTVNEVQEELGDRLAYTSVMTILKTLESKGHLRHEQEGPRYVYLPTVPAEQARATALRRVVHTFFGGSAEGAMAALLDLGTEDLDEEALERIQARIDDARREGR